MLLIIMCKDKPSYNEIKKDVETLLLSGTLIPKIDKEE